MGRPKIIVGPNDYEAWGKLVKTWATGKNYVDHPMTDANPVPTVEEVPPSYPKPRSFKEFVDQCVRAHVGLVFDDGLRTPVTGNEGMGFIAIQGDADVQVLRLPPYEKLIESEAKFMGGAAYQLPPFYGRIFGVAQPDPEQQKTAVQKMKIHAERVGEYTLNTCG
jgi:hypothetical protein